MPPPKGKGYTHRNIPLSGCKLYCRGSLGCTQWALLAVAAVLEEEHFDATMENPDPTMGEVCPILDGVRWGWTPEPAKRPGEHNNRRCSQLSCTRSADPILILILRNRS